MRRNFSFSVDEHYHLYSRGVEKRKIFLDRSDYDRFVKLLYTSNSATPIHLSDCQGQSLTEIVAKHNRGEVLVAIGAWCLMPNHFHILIKEISDGGISIFMKKLLTGYSMYFNTKYERNGALFSGAFKAKHLDNDSYLRYLYAYIHLNPISIIDKGWKEKKITDKLLAKKFLETYKYSSSLDYLDLDRAEKAILAQGSFPGYFLNAHDFNSMIHEWLNFNEQ